MALINFASYVCLLFSVISTLEYSVFGTYYLNYGECNYKTSFEYFYLDSIEISKKNKIGRVNIGESLSVEFELKINSMHGNYWASILQIGNEKLERLPGFWLAPNSLKLVISISEIDNDNNWHYVDEILEIGKEYSIKFTISSDGTIKSYINNEEKFSDYDIIHLSSFQAPIFIGNPWHTPVDGIVSNLVIKPFDDNCVNDYTDGISTFG
jgi:hypothetical protein